MTNADHLTPPTGEEKRGIQWTKAQERAIEAGGKSIVVSAAAGSGKTAVLCRRILKKLAGGDSISDLLVVTFTKAAASQLKRKLREGIRDAVTEFPDRETHLRRQLLLLPAAQISTIDSFYLDLAHRYYALLDIPAGVRVPDTPEKNAMERKCLDRAIEECENDPRLKDPLDMLLRFQNSGKQEEKLLQDYARFRSLKGGLRTVRNAVERQRAELEKPFFSRADGRVLLCAAREELVSFRDRLRTAAALFADPSYGKYGDAFCYTADFLGELITLMEEPDPDREKILAAISLWNPPYAKAKIDDPLFEAAKGIKTKVGKLFSTAPSNSSDNLVSRLYLDLSEEELRKRTARMLSHAETELVLLEKTDALLEREKKRLGVADFTDLASYAYRLLCTTDADGKERPTAVAKELAARYKEVLIDEYQDTNAIQDAVFSVLAPDSRFLVGDVKQSIYRFRSACPEIFENYRHRYRVAGDDPAAAGELINLSDNFRCDRSVIDFSNALFGTLFPMGIGVDYRPEDALIMGKKQEEDAGKAVRLVMTDSAAPEPAAGTTREAELLAVEIAALLREGRRPDDIAVLVRSLSKTEKQLRIALENAGIPYVIGEDLPMEEQPELLALHSLLKMGDNPFRDVDLVAGMTTPLFGFTLEELIALRQLKQNAPFLEAVRAGAKEDGDGGEKCRAVLEFLTTCRRLDCTVPPDRLVFELFERYHLLALLCTAPGDAEREAKRNALLRYYHYARGYASYGKGGLGGFLEAADRMMHETTKQENEGAEENAVRIMTIHKSKGLEFPVTIVFDCGRSAGNHAEDGRLGYDEEIGVSRDIPDEYGLGKMPMPQTAAHSAIKKRYETDEELRVLYVAVTRAREELILMGSCKDCDGFRDAVAFNKALGAPRGIGLLQKNDSYLYWTLFANAVAPMRLTIEAKNTYRPIRDGSAFRAEERVEEEAAPIPEREEIDAARLILRERFAFRYPTVASTLPAKLSVTALYPDLLDDTGGADLLRDRSFRTPRFIEERLGGKNAAVTAAERGTATHEFMQFCDFARVEETCVEKELERLCEEAFLSRSEAERVELAPLRVFFSSPLYGEMKRAKAVYREKRFNLLLPAAAFTSDPAKKEALGERELLVQGVIDCYYESEDGSLVLLDYKTDFFGEREMQDREACRAVLRERHAKQLAYYRAALERLTGKKTDTVLLWSFSLGEAVEITEFPDISL